MMTKSRRTRSLLFLTLGRAAILCSVAAAWPPVAAGSVGLSCEPFESSAVPPVAAAGEFRALFVLAEFPDQQCLPPLCGTACSAVDDPWAPGLATVPSWAPNLMRDAAPTSSGDSSLTQYFWTMSNGQHLLRGVVHPNVIEAPHTISYYWSHDGMNAAMMDVLGIVATQRADWQDFDIYPAPAGDGIVDFVFVLWRAISNGTTVLVDDGGTSGLFGSGSVPTSDPNIEFDWTHGARLNPRQDARGFWRTMEIAIHEYGHDLQNLGYALTPSGHLRSMARWGVMHGNLGVLEMGPTLMESLLRYKLGWISPVVLRPGIDLQDAQPMTVMLTDIGSTGSSGAAIVQTADPDQYFILEVRDSTGSVFTDTGTCPKSPGASGLLITHVAEKRQLETGPARYLHGWTHYSGTFDCPPPGCGSPDQCPDEQFPPLADVEAATGALDPITWRPDAASGWDNMSFHESSVDSSSPSDMYRPGAGQVSLFTPFTNPNTNLYWFPQGAEDYWDDQYCPIRRRQEIPSGLSFYNVRWIQPPGGGQGEMAVDVVWHASPAEANQLANGTTWSGRVQLLGDVVVPPDSTLLVEAGTEIFAAEGQDVFGADDAVGITVEGVLEAAGSQAAPVTLTSTRDAQFTHFLGSGEAGQTAGGDDWLGVTFAAGAGAGSSIADAEVRHATAALRLGSTSPALTRLTFSSNSQADILLVQDAEIPEGSQWELAGPVRVIAVDPPLADLPAGHAGFCDLIVSGALRMVGDSGNPAEFGADASGTWGGLVFDQAAVLSDLGQWSGEYTTHSLLQNVRIKNAVSGVRAVDTGAPALQAVEFQSIAGDQHIVLDGSDVYVPFDGGWTLGSGTRVKARPHQSGKPEIGGRNPGLVDLVVHGPLVTLGVQGDSVHFEPDGATPTSMALGQAWGGVFVDWMSTGGLIEYADIGYAPVPLALFLQNSTVRNSRLHHFRDQGLQVLGSWTLNGGPQIIGNLIERGEDLDGSVGRDGIWVQQVSAGNIHGNTVTIDPDADATGGGAAIRVTAGHTYCGAVSGAYSLYVDENTLTGPGGDYVASNLGEWSGIHGDWMCGSDTRDVFVRDNLIEGWNGAGITLLQTKDVQFTCNEVRDCFDGVDFSRNTDVTGPPARFRGNVLQTIADASLNNQDVARTDNAVKLALGPSTADKGMNHLKAGGQDWFVRENDEGPTAILNAAASLWVRNGAPLTDPNVIDDYFTKDDGVIDAIRVEIGTPLNPELLPDVCGSSGSATKPLPGETALQDGATRYGQGRPDAAVAELPERTELAVIRSTRGRLDVRVALSGRQSRSVDVEVFNVAGRRVRVLMREQVPGGRYGLSWLGDAEDGTHVTAGVYLVRMRAGDEVRVRKAVLVR